MEQISDNTFCKLQCSSMWDNGPLKSSKVDLSEARIKHYKPTYLLQSTAIGFKRVPRSDLYFMFILKNWNTASFEFVKEGSTGPLDKVQVGPWKSKFKMYSFQSGCLTKVCHVHGLQCWSLQNKIGGSEST
jgi:ribosomal protein S18 acetylase RimI-like enzyme